MVDNTEENPLLKALPPATDYVNYLILLEYNLTKEQLPTLHGVLQDTTLTANIGWDLVPLLLPLLPESRQCLQDVARLGNPREVVIKVTEGLQEIANEDEGEDEDEKLQEKGGGGDTEGLRDADQAHKAEVEKELVKDITGSEQQIFEKNENGGLKASAELPKSQTQLLRYTNLVEVLSIIHPRIKTKYPSRFLSTSLQAVLPAYSQVAHHTAATEVTLDMIKSIAGPQRPKLPPRKSSSQVHTATLSSAPTSAPDPEGTADALGVDEIALQRRLVQSFLTWVVEGFVSSVPAYEDLPGLAWSSRYYEKKYPEKLIPGRTSYTAMFADEEEEMHMRDSLLGQALAIARDLKLQPEELLAVITTPDPLEDEEEDLPSNAADVPLSRMGSLYLFCAIASSSLLFEAPHSLTSMTLFPDFAAIVQNSLGASSSGTLGSEAETAIDAVLFLGSFIVAGHTGMLTVDDDLFNSTLQRLSLLSANTPSPTLRFQAHLLTSSILHLHPSDVVRLSFIKDTLEHCPYENLKASAVGWLKDEILSAQSPPKATPETETHEVSIFATPAALTTLASDLLLNPSAIINEGPKPRSRQDAFALFQHHQPFFLAVLNLLYLLISSPPAFTDLQVAAFAKTYDVAGYCDRLRAASLLFQGWLTDHLLQEKLAGRDASGEAKGDEGAGLAELGLLDQTIERVMEAVGKAEI